MSNDPDITAGLFPSAPDDVFDGGAVAAAAGSKAFASFATALAPKLIDELRRRPFVHNIYCNGLIGGRHVLGLRLTNPHPDVVYLRNFLIEKPAGRYSVHCVLPCDNDKAKPYRLKIGGDMSFTATPAFDAEGGLTPAALTADLKTLMDQEALAVPPLRHVDLLLVVERLDGRPLENDAVRIKLASEGFRSTIADTAVQLSLRNRALS